MVLGAVATPGGHSNDDVWKVEDHLGIAPGIPIVMPSATGTPTQGGGWGHPSPQGTPRAAASRWGENRPCRWGEVFFLLFYYFILKPKAASLDVRLQQLHPTPEGKAGCVPSPRPPRSHWGRVR